MVRLPRLIGRGRTLEVLLAADDINAELADLYGHVNRALPDAELDGFIDALAIRTEVIAETLASFPSDADIRPESEAFRPASQKGIEALMEGGFHRPGDADYVDQIAADGAAMRRTAMARTRQLGEAIFRSILPEEIEWKPFSAFPPSARLAILVGEPSKPGPYLIRVKVPSGVKLMPHKHPEDRIYTVVSGVFYIGMGERFDGDKVNAYPPGSVIVLPGDTWHFHWAKSGQYVTQVTGIGPLGLEYFDGADDPRQQINRPGA